MSAITARRLVFHGKQEVGQETYELDAPEAGQVRVRTEYSLMSTGTENIVFNRLFDPGTHWDNWVKYPFRPGYATAGIVEAAGNGVSLRPGDRIAYRSGHCSHALLSEKEAYPIPDTVPSEVAAWFSLAKIGFQGARAADYRLGDIVLIVGAGPIGQMSLRWARAAGAATVAVIEPMAERAPFALSGGANAVISLPVAEARAGLIEACRELPRVVIDSTGNAAVFAAALGLAADRGKVVILGDTGSPAKQFLTSDVILRGLTVVGAHDVHNSETWNDATITRLFFALIGDGRFSLEGLNTHYFKPEQAGEAYLIANRDRARTMGVLFDWRP